MKTQINRITIDAEFTTVEELKKLLDKVVENYGRNITEGKSPFVKWLSYAVESKGYKEVIVSDLNGKAFRMEEINGETFMVVESKINKEKSKKSLEK